MRVRSILGFCNASSSVIGSSFRVTAIDIRAPLNGCLRSDKVFIFKSIWIWLALHRGSSPATSSLCDYVCYFPHTSDFVSTFSFTYMDSFNDLSSCEVVRVPLCSYFSVSSTFHQHLERSTYRPLGMQGFTGANLVRPV